jgi:phosphoribosylformylglycinamidine synthase I
MKRQGTGPRSRVSGVGGGTDRGPRTPDPGFLGSGRPRVAVVVFPGSNCDRDAMAAVEAVGGEAIPVWHEREELAGCRAVILPGGFSYGDYLRAGAMAAHSPVMRAIRRHAEAGGAVLGICNGFQMLLEVGLLPGATLMNRSLRFVCRDVYLRVERDDVPVLRHLHRGQVLRLPVAHKEGNWFAAPEILAAVEREGAVALRYCTPEGGLDDRANPNGALDHVAGLLNRDGNVLGMMPHPERRVTRIMGGEDGVALIRGLVEAT